MASPRPTYASVEKLRALCDPFEKVCWTNDLRSPLTREEVLRAAPLEPQPKWSRPWDPAPCSREEHAGRIRWLMDHRWRRPIAIDVGVPSLRRPNPWPILDGNHRFAAALLRGDARIRADFAGEVRIIRTLRAR